MMLDPIDSTILDGARRAADALGGRPVRCLRWVARLPMEPRDRAAYERAKLEAVATAYARIAQLYALHGCVGAVTWTGIDDLPHESRPGEEAFQVSVRLDPAVPSVLGADADA